MAKVEIYTVNYCPYCKKALTILNSYDIAFGNIDITDNEGEMRAKLQEQTGIRTVPQIFIDDEFVGGCDDLTQLHESGKLSDMLK